MIPYAKHNVTTDDVVAVAQVLQSDRLTQGPVVRQFEEEFAEKCGAKYCVAVSSGTAALHLAYLAVGVKPGIKVSVPAVTFVATANAALYCGGEVSFRDYEVRNESEVNVWTWVTLGGDPAPTIQSEGHDSRVVLDACHGPYNLPDGYDVACFSMHPCKHIAAGEGGAVVMNDEAAAWYCRALRDHGNNPTTPRGMDILGFNYRLNEMSAALALSQLQRLDENIAKRREISAKYDAAFTSLEVVQHSQNSARHLYQILLDNRDTVQERLAQRGVGTQCHYSPPIHLQPYYKSRFGYKVGDFPQAERFSARTLSLPLYPTLTEEEQDYVIEQVLHVVS